MPGRDLCSPGALDGCIDSLPPPGHPAHVRRTILTFAAAGMIGLLPSCALVGNIIRTPIRMITDAEGAVESGAAPATAETRALAARVYGP